MLKGRFSPALVLSIAALAAGCGASTPPPASADATKEAPKSETPAPGGEAAAEAPPSEEGEGDAEPPEPSFAELRKAAMACTPDENGSLDDCEAFRKWLEAEQAFENGKANPELLKMLGSQDPKERRVAAEKLMQTLNEETADAAKVDAVLGLAEKERDETLGDLFGRFVAGLPLVKVGKIDRAITIAKAHPVSDYTDAFVRVVGFGSTNRDPKVVAYGIEVSKDASASRRSLALNLLGDLAPYFPDETCKVINALRADKDDFVKNRAAERIASIAKCASFTDKLLDDLSTIDVKKNIGFETGMALEKICKRSDLTPAQRSKGSKAARRITDAPTVHTNTRSYTMAAIIGCDPKDGPAYVAKYKNDKDKTIAARAAELTK
ncbi:hypothetical protein [Polyangium jinanense]|uniref:HEAT repeat protein n=1 Tax=Polyangium jinanense TaxID=2829994 RepID=A0A9X3X4H6_9BACT|nr:hypothetical protein [Polyangium jinanense]MDC3962028.1 hypothetical protein [Polyangium jinanense]MDC3982380.1 hypothetical protein [Polyangium jinanense]